MALPVDDRFIWIDGCFDFFHHGHAGAIMQARQFGDELFVGIHTDEDIFANKGPVVMHLDERVEAVDACKWSTQSVPGAPYVTDPKVMDSYRCKYVVHGDDITTDADGNDCYQVVKDTGRFLVVKRTPNISTTDLVGRMLSGSTSHHFGPDVPFAKDPENVKRFSLYARGVNGLDPGSVVYNWNDGKLDLIVEGSEEIVGGLKQKLIYVDGGFDLFFVAHIEFLKQVREIANQQGAKVLVGVHSDSLINSKKGHNYPIMNQLERALCVLQCRYIDGVILNAPWAIEQPYFDQIEGTIGKFNGVYHGPTEVAGEGEQDPYKLAKQLGIFHTIGRHKYADMSAKTIVDRVLQSQELYEERQRKKGWKSEKEKVMEAQEKTRIADGTS